jgi:hypothetical protein
MAFAHCLPVQALRQQVLWQVAAQHILLRVNQPYAACNPWLSAIKTTVQLSGGDNITLLFISAIYLTGRRLAQRRSWYVFTQSLSMSLSLALPYGGAI